MPKAIDVWNELNERQRHYLQAIYKVDQEKEAYQKSSYTRGERAPKASVWRWILYTSAYGSTTPLQAAIGERMIDQGTGSTFEALRSRGLVELRYYSNALLKDVKLTNSGRAAVRAGTGQQRQTKPKGELSRALWKGLKKAYEAGEDGAAVEGMDWIYSYRWLINRKTPLVSEGKFGNVYITEAGRAYYEEYLDHHKAIYPDLYP